MGPQGVTAAPIWWDKNFFRNDSIGEYKLTRYAKGIAPTFAEFESGLVKLLQTAEWDDSEVALLYSSELQYICQNISSFLLKMLKEWGIPPEKR